MNESGLDQRRVENLLTAVLLPIQQNFHRGPVSRDRTYETLNALAAATAVVLEGCDNPKALEFFFTALDQHLELYYGESGQ